jgi:hypothetical protein
MPEVFGFKDIFVATPNALHNLGCNAILLT